MLRPLDGSLVLEANTRSKRDFQVVISAIIKVNLIAHVKTQSHWADVGLHPPARVNNAIGITAQDISHLGGKAAWSALIGNTKVQKSTLYGYECTHCASTGLELRPEQAVQGTQSAGHG